MIKIQNLRQLKINKIENFSIIAIDKVNILCYNNHILIYINNLAI